MFFEHIDWDRLWSESLATSSWSELSVDCWDKRAEKFNDFVKASNFADEFTLKMLEKMELNPGSTVLDIGCGPGTLAIPMARHVESVTALDISPEMLHCVKQNAAHARLKNIYCVNAGWEDVGSAVTMEPHDVVVVSRCIVRRCNRDTLARLNDLARKAVYLTYPLVHISSDRQALQAIGCGKRRLFPPYLYVVNMLYQMDIYPDIDFICYQGDFKYKSREAITGELELRLAPLTREEKEKLGTYITQNYHYVDGFWQLRHKSVVSWALLSWQK